MSRAPGLELSGAAPAGDGLSELDMQRLFSARRGDRAQPMAQDRALASLLRSLFAYPDVPESWRQPDFSAPSEPTLTLRLRRGDLALGFLTTMTVFSAPQNITLDELRLESYFPLDDATARACEQMARS